MSDLTEKYRLFGDPKALVWVFQMTDEHDMSGMERERAEAERMLGHRDFCLIACPCQDWDSDLPPWDAPAVFGNRPFRGGASQTLERLECEVIPELIEKFGERPERKFIIAGYSLAGLFALWCGYESERFDAVMAASPSVWFPGWIEYVCAREPKAKTIYLSLGDREEKTRNQVMARVGDCIRESEALLKEQGIRVVLEWNEGNHFKDSDLRCAKGVAWCVDKIKSAP